jgi:hypothetical protein
MTGTQSSVIGDRPSSNAAHAATRAPDRASPPASSPRPVQYSAAWSRNIGNVPLACAQSISAHSRAMIGGCQSS